MISWWWLLLAGYAGYLCGILVAPTIYWIATRGEIRIRPGRPVGR